ncbi:MAG: MOSC domain-containing protein [Sulfuricurvum sp.]
MQKLSEVLFLKISKPKELKKLTSDTLVPSAIAKELVQSAYLSFDGFSGDGVGDEVAHGGFNKTIHFISTKTYAKLNELSSAEFSYDSTAVYGENIVVDGIDESDICVGDIMQLGGATIEISQPRQPCWKLSANTKVKNMTSLVFEHGLTGWYARVKSEGEVRVGDELVLLQRRYPDLSIKALNSIIVDPQSSIDLTRSALECEELGSQFKASLQARSKLKDAKNTPIAYHKES